MKLAERDALINDTAVHENVTRDELSEVLGNLRSADKAELEAWGVPAEAAPRLAAVMNPVHSWVLYRDFGKETRPVFAFGLNPVIGGTFALWGFGTPDFEDVRLSFSKWMQKVWVPHVLALPSVHRIQAHVPLSSTHSWPWQLWLGFDFECHLRKFGPLAGNFVQVALTDKD